MRIKYRAEQGSVDEIWLDFAEDEDVQFLQNKVTEIAVNNNCHSYIADMTYFKGVSPHVLNWMNDF